MSKALRYFFLTAYNSLILVPYPILIDYSLYVNQFALFQFVNIKTI